MKLYHGTDKNSAKNLLNGELLDATKSSTLKIDGPPGFFLAFSLADAEFFALRRRSGAVVEYEASPAALERLIVAGAVQRPIPVGLRSPQFSGDELFVPIVAFEKFNELMIAGEIAL